MSQENVELVRSVSALLNSGDWEGAFAYFHPDIEWRDLMHAPDVPKVLHGRDAVRLVLAT
jgi:ketosteroid isomerase-like protein